MANTATTTLATRPPGSGCPTGNYLDVVIAYFNANNSTTLNLDNTNTFSYYRQAATPAPVANGKWDRIGADGFLNEPLGSYVFFNGRWVPDVSRRIGDLMITTLDPTGHMDSTGKGLFVPASPAVDTPNIAGPLFGWALANGQNGTYNIHNRFMLPGDMATSGHWVSNVKQPDGTFAYVPSGGRDAITLTPDMLGNAYAADYDSTASNATPSFYAGPKHSATPGLVNLSVNSQAPLPVILPLFCSVGVFSWIGYYAGSQG